jgi:hypothetical protein
MYKLIPLIFLLTGCAVIDAYRMGKYDVIEHDKINNIRSSAELSIPYCGDNDTVKVISTNLYNKSVELKNYSSTLPNNKEAGELSGMLVEVTGSMMKAYQEDKPHSKVFCELKLKNVEDSAIKIQTVIARKPR